MRDYVIYALEFGLAPYDTYSRSTLTFWPDVYGNREGMRAADSTKCLLDLTVGDEFYRDNTPYTIGEVRVFRPAPILSKPGGLRSGIWQSIARCYQRQKGTALHRSGT